MLHRCFAKDLAQEAGEGDHEVVVLQAAACLSGSCQTLLSMHDDGADLNQPGVELGLCNGATTQPLMNGG